MQENKSYNARYLLVPIALLLTILLYGSALPEQTSASEQISLADAEILIYLLPQAQEIRKQGMDIGWELQTSAALNQKDFYTFWVVNAKRPNVRGSVTVGFFDVNKHTAEVWDEGLERFVTSPDLNGVQRILRKAHRIDAATLEKFHSARPEGATRP